jgi:outer membrane protein assembly factor BamB
MHFHLTTMARIRLGISLFVWLIISAVAAVSITQSRLTFFRCDGGIAATPPGSLPEQLDSPDVLRWRTPLDYGHSTPIICNDRIFLTTYRPANKELATLALAVDTGRILWKQIAPAATIEEFNQMTGSAAQATPACDGERLYVFFGSCGLICYDLQGKQLWEHRMGPFQDEYGSASSPVLVDDKVIIQQDHDANSFLMALDSKSGKVLWKSERPNAVRSYSTPAVWTHNGRKELLVAGAVELAGYDPSDGKRLWWTFGLARIVIPTPVPSGDMVYMASWTAGSDNSTMRINMESWSEALRKYDRNGDGKLSQNELFFNPDLAARFFRMDVDQNGYLDKAEWERQVVVYQRAQNAVLAIKPSNAAGELPESALVWKCSRGAPYVATPLLDHGIVWTVKDGGIVTKINAVTGNVLQEKRLPSMGSYYASPVSAAGKILFASQPGVVSIISNESEWKPISSHDFGEKIYATPLAAERSLFIRTEKALYCFQAKK